MMMATLVAAKYKGTVKWFNEEKGFGFIVPDDSSEDVFVNFGAIATDGLKTLKAGERVEYDIEVEKKGTSAKNVIVLKELPE